MRQWTEKRTKEEKWYAMQMKINGKWESALFSASTDVLEERIEMWCKYDMKHYGKRAAYRIKRVARPW